MYIDDTHKQLAASYEFVEKFADSTYAVDLAHFEFAFFEAVNNHI